MALFMSGEELEKLGSDVGAVVARADAHISQLQVQLETQRARADAASISAEQNCSLIEQKYMSLVAQCSRMETENSQLHSTLERRCAELAQAQANAHKLELASMKQDNDVERLSFELREVQKAKRELLELVKQKSLELDEKNGLIKNYLEKVVSLTEERGRLEGKLHEGEANLIRLRAGQARVSQEKELVEQHNTWLNEEISSKANALLEDRRKSREVEADLCSRLTEAEKIAKEVAEALDRSQKRVEDLETKLYQVTEELRFTKEDAAAKEDHLMAEVTTASKLAELYKESSKEWAMKSDELEGVIKALEVHLNQVESNYNLKLQKEVDAREQIMKETSDIKEKLERKLKEAEADASKSRENHPLTWEDGGHPSMIDSNLALELHGSETTLPKVPFGVSGTALAATLLRDGWSLAKLYVKYQEAVDALRHERQGRNHSEALLERVLHEIEQKAEVIIDERAEHRRMVHAYKSMEEKLHFSMSDQAILENAIKELKADFRKKERELKGAQKEISDLQIQVSVLLKECADIQQRYKVGETDHHSDGMVTEFQGLVFESTESDSVISDRLLTFKDIHGMVEHNSQLRALVRDLALQNEQKEVDLKEEFENELRKHMDEESRKLAAILKRSEEQNEVIEALRGTVSMYKRLYEEESSSRRVFQLESGSPLTTSEGATQDLKRLLEKSQEEAKRAKEEAAVRLRSLEDDLNRVKHEVHKSTTECARADAEASYAREKLESVLIESEKQRKEMEAVLRRNMDFSQTITEYQRRLRESSQKIEACEEESRRFSIEVSVLEREKDLLANAEKRASQEVALLSERVHRLQATLDTIHNVEEVRELSRETEKRRLEEDVNHMQKEWAELKQELELERGHVRTLTTERERAVSDVMNHVETLSKELADALAALSAAETRARISEARSADLETSLRKAEDKNLVPFSSGKLQKLQASDEDIDAEIMSTLQQAQEEVQHLREDLVASKNHLEQYKKIAQANEEALKEMEEVHMRFKAEASHTKQANDMEVETLRRRLSELEFLILEKEKAVAIATQENEKQALQASAQTTELSESLASKQASLRQAEEQIKVLKTELDRQHHDWREAQCNYERQVLLQADTIRELNLASDKLSRLEKEVVDLLKRAEMAEADLVSARVCWETEKSSLQFEKTEAEKRSKGLDEQNQLLLNRLEAKHIQIAEKEARPSTETPREHKEEADLQNIIRYLRRSKEAADTEISLLKQERVRLHKQLEAAIHSSEEAQASLRREHEITRTSLYTYEDFKNLQAQVTEMNLLRESNALLREENRRNFEDSREARANARKAQEELDPLRKCIREKEIELEAAGCELDNQKAEIQRWQTRVSQLLEKYKAIDVEEHHRISFELSEMQERIKASEDSTNLTKKEYEEVKEELSKMEQDTASKDEKISELEKRLQESVQSEASGKTELDRYKRHAAFLKRKIDTLGKEKEDMGKEIEEFKANGGKKSASEASRIDANSRQETAAKQEQALKEADLLLKEKETRIQTLEKVLEKEREELRKERAKRQRDQKYFVDVAQKANQEKKRFLEEMESLKREKVHHFEQAQLNDASSSDQPGGTTTEERVNGYESAVDQMIEEALRVAPEIAAVLGPTGPLSASVTVSSDIVPASISIDASTLAAESIYVADALTSGISNSATAASIPMTSSLSVSSNAEPLTTAIIPLVTAVTNTNTLPSTSFISRPSARTMSVPTAPIVRPSIKSTTAPIPAGPETKEEKERAIQHLRAMIQEKEKVHFSSRKPARKIIRPRFEPSSQQDSISEGGEHTFELTAEGTEAEAEALEDSKTAVSVETLNTDNVPHSDIPAHGQPDQSVTEMAAAHVGALSLLRKRSASVNERTPSLEAVEQEDQSEAPQQKKLKGAETGSSVVISKSSLLSTEIGNLSTDVREAQPDSKQREDSDFPFQNKLGLRPPSPEISSGKETEDMNGVDGKREDDFKDLPAPKRTRLSTFDPFTLKVEELQKDNIMNHEGQPNKPVVSSGDGTGEASNKDIVLGDEDVEAESHLSDANLVESATLELEQSNVHPIVQSQLSQFEAADTSGALDISALDANAPPATPPHEGLLVELNSAHASKDSTIFFSQNPKDVVKLNQEPMLNEVDGVTTASDQGNDTLSGGTGTCVLVESVEEGEIMVESTEDTSLAEKTEFLDDHKIMEVELHKTTEFDTFETPVEKCEDGARVDVTELGVEPSITPSISESAGGGDSIIADPEEDKQTKDTPVSIAPQSSMTTRKSTTIHLAERARERSILRRGGMSPPSPGARGGRGRAQRGVKRASGASRGRVISTGVRLQGQPESATGELESISKGQTNQGGGSPPTPSQVNQSDVPKEEQQ